MAYLIKTGDTWPPMTVTLEESCDTTDPKRYHPRKADGTLDTTKWVRRVDLFSNPPDSIRTILKAAAGAPIEGPSINVEVVDGAGAVGTVPDVEPGLGVPVNRGQVRYPWQAGDTDVANPYKGETEVTWDSAATPPAVETFPVDPALNFDVTIGADLD